MPGQVEGKVALVTGAGSGIGRATAMTFASEGAAVVVADVNPEGGEETAGMVNGSGGEALFVETDVSKARDAEAMVAKAVEAYGRLDCAVNNAGIGTPVRARVHELPEDAWERVIDVNLKGVWLCMKYEISRMLSQGGGSIVNMASIAGLVGVSNSAAYTASKHGVVGLTKVAALEYAEQGIRVKRRVPGLHQNTGAGTLIRPRPRSGGRGCGTGIRLDDSASRTRSLGLWSGCVPTQPHS